MHILLTDLTVCPRCGPPFGLILLVEEQVGRRVARGALGCANCRERYPIEGYTGDFRLGVGGWGAGGDIAEGEAVRLTALAGVTSPPAYLLLLGPVSHHAAAAAALVPGVEVVATGRGSGEVSRLEVDSALPFHGGRFGGVIVTGGAVSVLLEEAVRVLRGSGRLVVQPVAAGLRERLAAAGMRVLVEDGTTMVCEKS